MVPMAVEIKVPQLGESVVEATIGRWLKQEGEAVAAGDVLVELETDNINVEVPSEQAGVLQRILHREGETVGVNEPLAVVADSAAASAPTPATAEAAPAPMPSAAEAAPDGAKPQPAQDNGRRTVPAPPVAQ